MMHGETQEEMKLVGAIAMKLMRKRALRTQSPGLLHQAARFAKAMTSGKATPELTVKRLAVCANCPGGQRYESNGHDFCRACHCPKWIFARLDRKAALGMDTCSQGYWKNLELKGVSDV